MVSMEYDKSIIRRVKYFNMRRPRIKLGYILISLMVFLIVILFTHDIMLNSESHAETAGTRFKSKQDEMNFEQSSNQIANSVNRRNNSNQIYSLYIFRMDGLGNQMFQYAALYSMGKLTNRKAVYWDTYPEPFSHLFPHHKIQVTHSQPDTRIQIKMSNGGKYHKKLSSYIKSIEEDVVICCWFDSHFFFHGFEEEVKQGLQFPAMMISDADRFLQKVRRKLNTELFIGLHIRRGDKKTDRLQKAGWRVADIEYIYRAMDYYKKKYKSYRITFVTTTDDREWTLSHLLNKMDIVISPFESAEVDMTLLSRCNHTIMTVGTFGWWAGWLAGGDVVYYKDFTTPGSIISQQYNASEFFMPQWIGL